LAQERQLHACRLLLLAPDGDMKKRKPAKERETTAKNDEDVEENADEGTGVDMSPEEIQAEARHQSAMLDELLSEGRRGTSRGAASGASRGSGPGRGRGWDAARRSSLLVSRFQPVQSSAPKASEPTAGAGNSNGDNEKEKEKESEPKEKKKKRKAKKADPGESVDVNPVFARAFPGGPRRKEADLPEREDEGEEEAPEATAEDSTGNVVDWLTSLGTENEAGKLAQPAAVEEVDWLSSIVSADAVVAGSKLQPSSTLLAHVGKPLPIPPFWRTASADELNAQLTRQKARLWDRMKRMRMDANRVQKKRGKVKVRTMDLRK